MKRRKDNGGFTLVEMLACVITLLLIGMICSTGMNFAATSYHASLFESDSQMLESTINMYVGDILRHATSIQTEDVPVNPMTPDEKYVKAFTNAAYQIYDGKIEVPEKTGDSGGSFLVYESRTGTGELIVGQDAYAKTLYIDEFTLIYNTDTGVFTGRYVIKSTILEEVFRECTFAYRTIAEI